MIWITVLFGLLGLLLQWWLNRKKSGVPPTARDIRNTNRVIGYLEQIKSVAVPMGCDPQGSTEPIDDEQAAHHLMMSAGGMEWSPGELVTDKLYAFMARKLTPYARKRWPDLPGTDAELEQFILRQIKEAMG